MKLKNVITIGIMLIGALFLIGCSQTNTVEGLVVTNEKLTKKTDIESAKQPKEVSKEKDVYACVYLIESPKGMEYTGAWYINDEEVKSESLKMTEDRKGSMIYTLESDQLKEGTLKFTISYKKKTLSIVELDVK